MTIRHSTLVPGWGLECDCEPTAARPSRASSCVNTSRRSSSSTASSARSRSPPTRSQTDPGRHRDQRQHRRRHQPDARGARRAEPAAGVRAARRSRAARCSARVNTHAIELAENSIFTGLIRVARRQHGCMRFCYVHARLAHAAALPLPARPGRGGARRGRTAADAGREARAADARGAARAAAVQQHAATACRPTASSPRPAPRRSRAAPTTSRRWAPSTISSSRSATANLRARLDEYTPAGMDAGIMLRELSERQEAA